MDAKLNIVFVEKDKLYFTNGNGVFACKYPDGLIVDMEVISVEGIKTLISKFIFENKFTPGEFVVIMSDSLSFRDDVEIVSGKNPEQQLAEFKLLVPMDNVVCKSFNIQNGLRCVAINKDLSDVVIDQFMSNGFTLVSLIPACVLPAVASKTLLDDEVVRAVESLANNLKSNSMYSVSIKQNTNFVDNSMPVQQSQKSKLPYLLGVFVVLLFILIFYLLTSN